MREPLAELEFGVYYSRYPEQNQGALSQYLSPLEIALVNDRAAME